MKYLSFIMLLSLILGCSLDSKGPQQAEYWKAEVVYLNQKKPSLKSIVSRYDGYDIEYDTNEGLIVVHDHGNSNSIVCGEWHYVITIEGSDEGYADFAKLDQIGTCL